MSNLSNLSMGSAHCGVMVSHTYSCDWVVCLKSDRSSTLVRYVKDNLGCYNNGSLRPGCGDNHKYSSFRAPVAPVTRARQFAIPFCIVGIRSFGTKGDDVIRSETERNPTRLGISTREVALFSKTIADAEGKQNLDSSPWVDADRKRKSRPPKHLKLFLR